MIFNRVRRRRSHSHVTNGNSVNLSPKAFAAIALFIGAFICFVLVFNLKNKFLKVLFIILSIILAFGSVVNIIGCFTG